MPETAVDLTLLEWEPMPAAGGPRRALVWLSGLLLMVGLSIAGLAMFLNSVEEEETHRRRVAEGQWLDQTLRFHFRRLEADLTAADRMAQGSDETATPFKDVTQSPRLKAGQLWRSPGVLLYQGSLLADQQDDRALWPEPMKEAARVPELAQALQNMLLTSKVLQRTAYAGPLQQSRADEGGHILWVAVPQLDEGRVVRHRIAAVQLERALSNVIPFWFARENVVGLAADGAPSTSTVHTVPIHIPGVQIALTVRPLTTEHALAPRLFFGVALMCLLAMAAALIALWRDTGRRQRIEAQLQTQRVLREAMERAVLLGLRAWNTQGRLLYANEAFCRMVGWRAQDLVGREGPMPYWPVEQGDELKVLQDDTRPLDAHQAGVELRLCHRDGRLLDVLVHGAPLTLSDGTCVGWMGSALDITERKHAQQLAARQHDLLQASGRLIVVGEVASTLAHELNQPLGALSSFANGLLNRLQQRRITLEEVSHVVARMAHIANKAGRVIQRVNAFARRQDVNRQMLALRPFVSRVVAQVPHADNLTLQLLPSAIDDSLAVPADALLLEHALHNVVLNATEWATRGGAVAACVQISLVRDTDMVGIRVADSGPGVSVNQVPGIFDAFATQKEGGMGMGLSICRSIMEAHHGRIDVATSPSLQGAQFTLWLPLTP